MCYTQGWGGFGQLLREQIFILETWSVAQVSSRALPLPEAASRQGSHCSHWERKAAASRALTQSLLSAGCLGQLSELCTLSLPITLLRAVAAQLWVLPSLSELLLFLLLGCRCSGRSPCQPLPRPSACPQPHLSWPLASVVSAGGAWPPPSSAGGETSVLIPQNMRHVLKPGSYGPGQGETSRRLLGQK